MSDEFESEERPEEVVIIENTNIPEKPEVEADAAPDRAESLRVLEAFLFASAEPVGVAMLQSRFPEINNIKALLDDLKARYEGCGVVLTEAGGMWAFRTAPDLGDALAFQKTVQRKFSRAALETLAIIAYHQPVTRAEIESIRGVATNKGTLDVLLETGWIKPGRRKEVPGRPLTWVTTPGFLDHFGLSALGDLPGIEDLKASGLLDKRPAVESVTGQSGLFPAGWTPEEGANDLSAEVSGDSGDESGYSADEDAA